MNKKIKTKSTGNVVWLFVLFSIPIATLGCGDSLKLGTVQGTVTLDGQPLAGVMVQFHSDAGGRPGSGVTGSDGKYELIYGNGREGTLVGPSKVEITTVWPHGAPEEGESETIPAKYNSNSTLKRDVLEGDNTFDFALESEGGTTNGAE